MSFPRIQMHGLGKELQLILLVSFSLVLCFILIVLSNHNWDPMSFSMLRPENVPIEQTWGIGYDGQYSYAIAVQPWGSTENIDKSGYRYQRILYPLLIKLFSFGKSSMIPWLMIAINLAAATVACASLALLLLARKSSPYLAFVFILFIGFLLSVRMNLSEPLALALALAGWLAYEREKPVLAVTLFVLCGLAKEVGLTFPAALVVWELLRRNWRRAGLISLGSFTPYLLWYIFLYFWFGISDEQITMSSLLLIPFWGLQYLKEPISRFLVLLWVIIPAIIAGAASLVDLLRGALSSSHTKDTLLVLSHVALISVLPILTWEDPLAIFRFGIGLIAATVLWLSSYHPRVLPYAVGLWLPSGLLLFLMPGLII